VTNHKHRCEVLLLHQQTSRFYGSSSSINICIEMIRSFQSISTFRRKDPTLFALVRYFSESSSSSPLTSTLPIRYRWDVAIVGLPNAGKSQILNVMTQSPVSAVSRKRHTTRTGVLGVRTVHPEQLPPTQLVFVDTPGFMRTMSTTEKAVDGDLVQSIATHMEWVDSTLVVVDAARCLTDSYQETLVALMMQALRARGRMELVVNENATLEPAVKHRDSTIPVLPPFAIVMNKVDLVHPKSELIDTAEAIAQLAEGAIRHQWKSQCLPDSTIELDERTLYDQLMPTFFYVSALKEPESLNDILDYLVAQATPCRSWEVEEEGQVTNLTPEERAAEMVREKVYRCLHQEVPYQIQVVNRMFRVVPVSPTHSNMPSVDSHAMDDVLVEKSAGLHLYYDLVVSTSSHAELVKGRAGLTLEAIRRTAERDLQNMFHCPVRLQLHVKLNKSKNRNWTVV
jgi:GTPase